MILTLKNVENNEKIRKFLSAGNYVSICTKCIVKFKKLYQATNTNPQIGDVVKVDFHPIDSVEDTEAIWIEITQKDKGNLGPWFGTLANVPGADLPGFKLGDEVAFNPKEIMMYIAKGTSPVEGMDHIIDATQQVQKLHDEEEHGN